MSADKIDRHGRRGSTDWNDVDRSLYASLTGLSELSLIARQVYVDRNAKGYPPQVRQAAKIATRKAHREALRHAAKARDATLRNDEAGFLLEYTRAHLALTHAQSRFRQAYIDRLRESQRARAKKPRSRLPLSEDADEKSIAAVVRSIAFGRDEIGSFAPAKELWGELFARIDEMHLNPKEETMGSALVIYYEGGKIAFNSFKAMLSKERGKQKLT